MGGHLALILPKRQKLSRGHHAAMPYSDLPEFIAKLRDTEPIHALALEFLILTAARSGEVLGATWDEIDIDAQVWVIPASRMKAGREHRVPLSARAMAILDRMAEFRTGDLVFLGQRRRRPIVRRGYGRARNERDGSRFQIVRFGIGRARKLASRARSPSRRWRTRLATRRSSAYRRGDALEKRRGLMTAWANYCEPSGAGNVVAIRG